LDVSAEAVQLTALAEERRVAPAGVAPEPAGPPTTAMQTRIDIALGKSLFRVVYDSSSFGCTC